MRTDYKFGFFDAQIMLVTDYHLLKSRGRLSREELATKLFQNIAKCVREICNCDKIFLLWDKGPYYRSKIVEGHKKDRFYVTQQVIDDYSKIECVDKTEREAYIVQLINENSNLPKEELDELIDNYRKTHPTVEEYEEVLKKFNEELRCEKIKNETKYWIINNFAQIGLPSLIYDGYEADDLAYLCLKNAQLDSSDSRKSYICSKDSDWKYLLTPNSEIMVYHRANMLSYDDVYKEMPEYLQKKGVKLYDWKAVTDSLTGSHNNFQNCLKTTQFDYGEVFDHLDDKDWLETICDTDVFLPQLKSFDISKFPDYDDVFEDIYHHLFSKEGSIASEKNFKYFAQSNNLRISTNYYSNFVSLINEDCYSKQDETSVVDIDELLNSI